MKWNHVFTIRPQKAADLPRSRHDQRLDLPAAAVKFQIHHAAQPFAVTTIDYFLFPEFTQPHIRLLTTYFHLLLPYAKNPQKFTRHLEKFISISIELSKTLVDSSFIYSSNNIFCNTFNSISHLISKNKKCKYYNAKEYINFKPTAVNEEFEQLCDNLETLIHSMINATISQNPACVFIMAGLVARFFSIMENPDLYQKEIIQLVGSNDENLIHQITKIFEKK